jgi:HEAT repeat protein
MKRIKLTGSWLLSVVFVTIMLISTTSLNAQKTSISSITTNKYALKNLLTGIKSDNEGVKRSCIYFAGKYKIAEAESALIQQLGKEKNAGTRILISLVLFEMGSIDGLLEVQKLSKEDIDPEVRRMSTHIYHEFLINDVEENAIVSK